MERAINRSPQNARLSAAIGAVFWIIVLFIRTGDARETELIQKITFLGILVIVPLAMSLVPALQTERESILYRAAVSAQPVGAVATVLSFFLTPGIPAATLALSWLLVTMVIAVFALWRLLKRGPRLSGEIFVDAGMLFLPVGAGWLLASRFGTQPIGFGETIVLLTATHFHFAGFAAPILTGMAGRALVGARSVTSVFGVSGILVIAGTPLVAAGITFSPAVAMVGAVVISIGLVVLAVLVLGWVLRRVNSFATQTLLVVSSLSSVAAMVMACLYAYSIVAKSVIVDIPQMAMTHGVLNSFGFALCGLVAWSLARQNN